MPHGQPELAVACAEGDPATGAEEAADVLYHVLDHVPVACLAEGVALDDVLRALERRTG